MLIDTFASGNRVVLATNAADSNATFDTVSESTTRPSGVGVFDMSNNGNVTRNAIRVKFFGTDTANQIFKCRILGWNKTDKGSATYDLYDYIVLCDLVCTLGAKTGVANSPVNASQLWVDTITLATGYNDDVDISITSPANDEPAHIILDTKGCELIQFIFSDGDSSPAVSYNATFGVL